MAAAHAALSSRLRAKIGDLILPGKFRYHSRGAHRFAASIGALLIGAAAAAIADTATPRPCLQRIMTVDDVRRDAPL